MAKKNKPKPDDRRDNVGRIKNHIDHTIQNMELAEDMIRDTDHEKTKKELREKNERREDALKGMRKEIRDEANARKNGYR